MQTNMQPTGHLANLLSGQPVAIAPGFWSSVAGEIDTIGTTITAADIEHRRKDQAARIINPETGQVVANTAGVHDSKGTPAGSFAHLQLTGVMLSQDFLWYRGVNHLAAELIAAENNPNVVGILLEVNSGGGQARAGQMLLSTMESLTKPVYVLAHYMASAAVMATLPAHVIAASSPGVEVGSIGTYVQIHKGAVKYENDNYKTIYAAKSTLKNRFLRAILKGDYDPYEKYINQVNEMFLANVRKHRKVTADTLTGDMFFAKDAKAKGLIDMVKSYQEVLAMMRNKIAVDAQLKKRTPAKATATVKPLPPSTKPKAVAKALPPVVVKAELPAWKNSATDQLVRANSKKPQPTANYEAMQKSKANLKPWENGTTDQIARSPSYINSPINREVAARIAKSKNNN